MVDPEVTPLLDFFPQFELKSETLNETRAILGNLYNQVEAPAFPDIEVNERQIPGPEGAPDVRVLLYLPKMHLAHCPGCSGYTAEGMCLVQPTRMI
ncbi:MAG TPA: hypothetical protein VH186_08950 [Chloroflexia bacterium]|nr:hypothetical protein [Chloroflexia bacterium]